MKRSVHQSGCAILIALLSAGRLQAAPSDTAAEKPAETAAPITKPADTPPATEPAAAPTPAVAPVETAPPPPPTFHLPPATLAPAPEPARLDLGERPTHFERIRKVRRWGLFSAGAILFLGAYGADIGMTYGFLHQPSTNSLIPLVGPLVQYTDHFGLDGPPVNTGSADADRKITSTITLANTAIQYVDFVLLGVDAALQFIGATMMIVGVATKNTIVTYERAKDPKTSWDWQLMPTHNGAALVLHY